MLGWMTVADMAPHCNRLYFRWVSECGWRLTVSTVLTVSLATSALTFGHFTATDAGAEWQRGRGRPAPHRLLPSWRPPARPPSRPPRARSRQPFPSAGRRPGLRTWPRRLVYTR